MTYDVELADRIRSALEAQPSIREVKMFGGLSFMVNDAMVMNVGSAGDLLVRVDPERHDEYLAVKGAHPAEMGKDRTMGPGWLAVDSHAVAADEDLAFWIEAVLDLNRRMSVERPRRAKRRTAR